MSTSTFVAMARHDAQWGIHAQLVRAIVDSRQWHGSEPLDVSRALGISAASLPCSQAILLLGAAENPSPIRALGAVVLRQVVTAHLWPLPPLVQNPDLRQTVSAVAFSEGELPLLVLDPLALLALASERRTS